METKVTLKFGLEAQGIRNIADRLAILQLKKSTGFCYKGHLQYVTDLLNEIAEQLPESLES